MKTEVIKNKIREKGYTYKKIADELSLSEKALYNKLQTGRFWMSEVVALINILQMNDIKEILYIFFD